MKFYPVTRTRLFSLMLALLGLLSSFIPASVPERGKSPAPGVSQANPAIQSAATSSQTPPPAREKASVAYGKLPLSFEANQGQTDKSVNFVARGGGYSLFL